MTVLETILKYADRLCAIILVVGLCLALCLGVDGETKSILGVATGYLFGAGKSAMVSKN